MEGEGVCQVCLLLTGFRTSLKYCLAGVSGLVQVSHDSRWRSSSFISARQLFQPHNYIDALLGGLEWGGVHDSYTFQCRLVGYFTSPGIDTI